VAIAEETLGMDVSISHTSFMLRPDYPKAGVDKLEFFKQKFGGEAPAKQFFTRIVDAAKEEGIHYAPLDGLKTGNTSDAHRLMLWARSLGKEDEVLTEMYKAYNCDGKWVGDHDVLLDAAAKAGLDPDEAKALLEDQEKFKQELDESLGRSAKLGVSGVPAFFINGQNAGSGAQPAEFFVQAFQQIAKM